MVNRDIMTIREMLAHITQKFKATNIDAPAVDAGVIICHVLGCGRVYLYSHGEEELSPETFRKIQKLAEERLQRKPLQYITGCTEFMSLLFLVSPAVLIPRQETETLIETVIGHCSKLKRLSEINILDIGTGSGCIAVSLARFIENSRVTAVDISEEALKLARMNAEKNSVADKLRFVRSNLFSGLDYETTFTGFDVIVSNPPYIRSGDISGLEPEVSLHEPLEALDGGSDGMDFYRSIISQTPKFLKQGGMLAFETGYDQSEAVAAMMADYFSDVHIVKDLAGIGRVVCGIIEM